MCYSHRHYGILLLLPWQQTPPQPSYETLSLSRPKDYVVQVHLNRPEKRNAMNSAFWRCVQINAPPCCQGQCTCDIHIHCQYETLCTQKLKFEYFGNNVSSLLRRVLTINVRGRKLRTEHVSWSLSRTTPTVASLCGGRPY